MRNPLAAPALAGLVVGLGLALGTNVSGAVLALYGLGLAVLLALMARALRRGRDHPPGEG